MVIRPVGTATRVTRGADHSSVSVPNSFINSQQPSSPHCEAAWSAIARKLHEPADEYWLITQVDHAELAGALAQNFRSRFFPQIPPDVQEAIGVHDAGWAALDHTSDPSLTASGRPQSFLDVAPDQFLEAWAGSIERAEQISAAGGYVVSGHFYRLGKGRLDSGTDQGSTKQLLADFVAGEEQRRETLARESQISREELERFVDVLQFCDVLSLYLCSGAEQTVEFPQTFGGARVQLQRVNGAYHLTPSPFEGAGGLSLAVSAVRYPSHGSVAEQIPFLLW